MKKAFHPVWLATVVLTSGVVPAWAGEPVGVSTANMPTIQIVRIEQASSASMKVITPETSLPPQHRAGFLLAAPETLELYNHAPADLTGETLFGSEGKPLGEVTGIVSDRISGRIYAVVSSGGFLGFGASRYAVPLDGMRKGEKAMHVQMSAAELEMSKEYTAQRYVNVKPESRPISEFSAFATTYD